MNNLKKITNHLIIITFCLFIIGCYSTKTIPTKEQSITSNSIESVLDNVLIEGILRVGTTGDFSPFSYQLQPNSHEFHGVDIELAKDLATTLGVKVQFVPTSWPTLMSDLANHKFDICMSGVTIKLIRQKVGLFSIPVLASGKAAITRDENVEKYSTIAAINQAGVRVIVNPGGTNEAFAKANFPNATIIQNEDNLSIFQKIIDGEADLMVTDAVETLVQQLIHPELDAVNPNQPFNFFEMGYLLPRDFVWKAYVDQWLNLRQKEGRYQKIFDQELGKIKVRAMGKE